MTMSDDRPLTAYEEVRVRDLSAMYHAELTELRELVTAFHGPRATVTPLWKVVVIRFGVQWESPPWGELAFTLRRYRESVHKAATQTPSAVAAARAKEESEVARVRYEAAEWIATLEARAERCRALLG
jgi:hypothetical protein